MSEKFQVINGNWWYMYGSSWKDLCIPSSVPRSQMTEQSAEVISEFRKHVDEESQKSWVKNAINSRE